MNGSLWTLFYEALCYAAVVALGVVGALRRHPVILLAVVGLIWVMIAMDAAGLALVSQERMPRFAFMFLLGSAMLVFATRIPIRGGLAAAGAVLVVCGLVWLPDYRAVAGPAFAYVCLWLAVVRPPKSSPKSDYSYGLYVYHWPILQILAVTGGQHLGEPAFVLLGLALALGVAAVSWIAIERPALRFKDAAWVTHDWTDRVSQLRR
jgi:peptidoglycan/LPS O-acetylase OafA/YrhL